MKVRALPATPADGRKDAETAPSCRSRGWIGAAGAAVFLSLLLAAPAAAGTARAGEVRATVAGEVNRPGTYAMAPGETLSALIERAGGYTDNAFLRGAALTRKREMARGREEIDRLIRTIEERIRSGGRPGERDASRLPDAARAFLDLLRALPASGRVPVRLSHPRLLKGSERDIALEDGDTLVVPAEDRTVSVAGAVRSPGRFPFESGRGFGRYARTAGGYTDDADPGGAFLLAADGTAARLRSGIVAWNPRRARWELSAFREDRPAVGPGDTIVVPRDPRRIPWMEKAGDISPVLSRIAEITGQAVTP